jgi:hypothetical protein
MADNDAYNIGFEYISDTAAHTGRFWKLYAVADAVISTATIQNASGNTFSSVPLGKGDQIEGVFTSVTLASGKIVAYKL